MFNTTFVDFETWCKKCKRKTIGESPKTANESKEYDICNECLGTPTRTDGSYKPLYFKKG
jgi:hypothetical protein